MPEYKQGSCQPEKTFDFRRFRAAQILVRNIALAGA
jgi:hypothetical protein